MIHEDLSAEGSGKDDSKYSYHDGNSLCKYYEYVDDDGFIYTLKYYASEDPYHCRCDKETCEVGSFSKEAEKIGLEIVSVTTFTEGETDYTTLPQADYILVTHEHFDHLDSVAINQLSKEGTVLITNARCHEILGGKGDVLANGDSRTLAEGWTVDAVPAYNNSPEKLQFHPKGRDNGFVLTIEGMRI